MDALAEQNKHLTYRVQRLEEILEILAERLDRDTEWDATGLAREIVLACARRALSHD
jgi:hypothetical protein